MGAGMEPKPKADSPWCKSVPNLQVAWDNTCMSWLQDCPRKYQLSMIEGWHVKKIDVKLLFGQLLHKALEIYDHHKAAGRDHDGATRESLRFCLFAGRELLTYDDNTRTRFTLCRSVVWYLDQFKDDPAKTVIFKNGKPAVELSFRAALPMTNPDGDSYLWCGHIDRLVDTGMDSRMVSDRKTTGYNLDESYFDQYVHDNQMTGYIFGAKSVVPKDEGEEYAISFAMIDAVETKVNFNRFARSFVQRTPSQVEEWIENTLWWIKQAERFAESNFWPTNRQSCNKFGGCPFRKVCSKDKSTRHIWLNADFTRREWNPLANREA